MKRNGRKKDGGQVWDEIRDFGDKLGGASSTGALDSIYARRRTEMEAWMRAYPLRPRQIGLLAYVGSGPLGLDAVGSPGLLTGLHQRILTGYILDAMESSQGIEPAAPQPRSAATEPASASLAEAFVEAVRGTERTPSESVGLGEYRILRGEALGGELAHDDHLVHLSTFPTEEHQKRGEGEDPTGASGPRRPRTIPIARPSRRRRF